MVLIRQQRETDCGVAALATYLQIPYGDANDAVLLTLGQRLGAGVYAQTLIRAAERLGRKLRRRRKVNLQEAAGILDLDGPKHGHLVVLLGDGQLYDPADNSLRDAEDYVAAHEFRVCGLLV